MSETLKQRSGAWYLLPIFLTIIGGIIAYFVIKDDDPKKAKNCLYLGIVLTAIGVGFTVVSGAMFAYEMENSPFFDENFKNSDFVTPSEMTVSDKLQINSLAEDVEYEYNAHGLKANYIQLQDEDGNIITAVEHNSLYQVVSEVQNRDEVEKTLVYDIFVNDDDGNASGVGGETIIPPQGIILIDGGWHTMSPGIYEIEMHLADGHSDIDLDFQPFWRVLYLE